MPRPLLAPLTAPALVKCRVENEQYFLLLLPGHTGNKLRILGPDLRVHRRPIAELTQALCAQYAGRFSAEVEQLLISARIPERDQARVRIALLRERLATVTIPDHLAVSPSFKLESSSVTGGM